MKLIFRYPFIAVSAFLLLSLTGCELNIPEQINFIPYSVTDNNSTYTNSLDEVLSILIDTMEHNQPSCTIYVKDSSIIDSNELLNLLPGLTQIECRQRNSGIVTSMEFSLQYWDNYPIYYAYKNNTTSYLNERQLQLYNTYLRIINEITSPDYSDWQNEIAIHDYLVANIIYTDGIPGNNFAYNALIDGTAVCSGYTEAFKTFMDFLGIENQTVSGSAGSEKHIWNLINLDNQWYHVDVTWDDPVNSYGSFIDHTYFNITDSDIGIDHSWEYSSTPAANGTEYSYVNIASLTNITSQQQLSSFLSSCLNRKLAYIEFTSSLPLDVTSALAETNINLTYYYKNTERTNYNQYTLLFFYN